MIVPYIDSMRILLLIILFPLVTNAKTVASPMPIYLQSYHLLYQGKVELSRLYEALDEYEITLKQINRTPEKKYKLIQSDSFGRSESIVAHGEAKESLEAEIKAIQKKIKSLRVVGP